MTKNHYLTTNEHEEAVRSLEWAEQQARTVCDDPYQWKWVIVSLHNAVQGFMVLSLWNGNGVLALREDAAEEWLKADQNKEPFPDSKLDNFLNLFKKIKSSKTLPTIGKTHFAPGRTHGK